MTPAAIAALLQERIAAHMESVLGYSVQSPQKESRA